MTWRRRKDEDPRSVAQAKEVVRQAFRVLGGKGDIEWEETEDATFCQIAWEPGDLRLTLRPPEGDQAGALLLLGRLMQLPEGSALPLYRRLLDMNAAVLVECAFGLRDATVVVTAECRWEALTIERTARLVALVCDVIDDHTNELAGEFGCTRICDLGSRAA